MAALRELAPNRSTALKIDAPSRRAAEMATYNSDLKLLGFVK